VIYSVKLELGRLMVSFSATGELQITTAWNGLPSSLAEQVQAAVTLLKNGGVIAFPTDTLYGLGADFSSPKAVQRVLDIKGRALEMGLPLLLADADDLAFVAEAVPAPVLVLARRFWPGALTLVVSRSSAVPDVITGGRDTVAVRVPDHPVPVALARGLGRPITGTSANLAGRPPALTAEDARSGLGESVDLIIDGGPAQLGVQSTIVDATGPLLKLVRPGAISLADIRSVYSGEVIAE
jgi:L-threonylcarbamoyladenylate synthase